MLSRRWLLLLVFMLWTSGVWAASTTLTEEQYGVLKNDILVTHQAEFAQAVSDIDDAKIAQAYNLEQSPVFWCWKTALTRTDIYDFPSVDNTNWSWEQYVAQAIPEQNAWQEMWMATRTLDMSRQNVQDGITRIFKGTGAAVTAQRTHVFTAGRRHALRGETLFCTGCVGTTAQPGVLVYEGTIRPVDVGHALRGIPLP